MDGWIDGKCKRVAIDFNYFHIRCTEYFFQFNSHACRRLFNEAQMMASVTWKYMEDQEIATGEQQCFYYRKYGWYRIEDVTTTEQKKK